jgi:hypothetical protein
MHALSSWDGCFPSMGSRFRIHGSKFNIQKHSLLKQNFLGRGFTKLGVLVALLEKPGTKKELRGFFL